ncbi:uncharacterized protein LOC17889217 [Capsella rubella]|uniref:uncharacterized protein LOC17889217 n=1 Tax=Capsella rubella TaxID=81985 RepID=UPI000CD5C85B|nr:uncharacterized protein LOC17889217 [Capsella rubella]
MFFSLLIPLASSTTTTTHSSYNLVTHFRGITKSTKNHTSLFYVRILLCHYKQIKNQTLSLTFVIMTDIDLEQGGGGGGAFGYHRRSLDGSDVSVYYSDGEDVTSCYSYFYSTTGGSYEYEGGDQSRKVSSVMSPSSELDDDDDDDATAPPEKDCRICHMGVETSGGGAIELGCSCKEDLAVAHRQCAETWFKIKGDKICEICQSVARNVGGGNEMVGTTTMEERELDSIAAGGATAVENRWQPQRVVNLVLACMVFGFFISWIFHFHVSSSS